MLLVSLYNDGLEMIILYLPFDNVFASSAVSRKFAQFIHTNKTRWFKQLWTFEVLSQCPLLHPVSQKNQKIIQMARNHLDLWVPQYLRRFGYFAQSRVTSVLHIGGEKRVVDMKLCTLCFFFLKFYDPRITYPSGFDVVIDRDTGEIQLQTYYENISNKRKPLYTFVHKWGRPVKLGDLVFFGYKITYEVLVSMIDEWLSQKERDVQVGFTRWKPRKLGFQKYSGEPYSLRCNCAFCLDSVQLGHEPVTAPWGDGFSLVP